MSISQKDLDYIKERFINSARPLIFYDDDPDGLCSFLQFYHLNTESKGIVVNTKPFLDESFTRKVEEYQPDLVIVLDMSDVSQDFIDGCKSPIIWIDHHKPVKRNNIKYFNPMIDSDGKDNRSVSYWSYKITGGPMWLAMIGCTGDWMIPDFAEEFSKEYPKLLESVPEKPDDVLFESRVGDLVKAFNYVMKGGHDKSKKCIKILTRIKDPFEILDETTAQGKFIYRHYNNMNEKYEDLKSGVKVDDSNLLMYICPEDKTSFTSMLSNEILHFYPNKFIIIGRKKSGHYRISLRSKKYEVREIVDKALVGVQGYGGGHRYACGANIQEDSFDQFLNVIKEEIK
ncbi:DHH family phosphoesterase [archaeon]|jgi:single-stranded DNA-specific DHH superfamily exonuclease|nr:DHH family phosphoesterase [archaeon]MBT4352654.1 DHH family phosphoesterase [archaeon]MBT4646702.1 DHH family phosphoesterase [archaeon]MBT6821848.1 DHH family phosphoesterase [archaeon]MBT7392258.1 DHH family phosphoesterase [archaeon]